MVEINNAITIPEDEGTGLADGEEPDWVSAGHVSGLQSRNNAGYVETGLTFDVDFTADELFISSGLARILYTDVVEVQDDNGDYTNQWDDGVVFTAALPDVDEISLIANEVNYIYLELDLTQNNGAEYIVGTPDADPTEPALLLGLVDTTDETIHETYRSGPSSQHSIRPATFYVERGEEFEIPDRQGEVLAGPVEGEGTIKGEGRLKVV